MNEPNLFIGTGNFCRSLMAEGMPKAAPPADAGYPPGSDFVLTMERSHKAWIPGVSDRVHGLDQKRHRGIRMGRIHE